MERIRDLNNKSFFYFLKNKPNVDFHQEKDFFLDKSKKTIDINIIISKLSDLEKLIQKNANFPKISELLKDLEILNPNYNNDKSLMQIFYNSKLFLSLINLTKIVKDNNITSKLLSFIEKIMKSNKNISRYLSKNYDFLNLIMEKMKESDLFEICIKICEDLFINSQELVPISELKFLKENYLLYFQNRLDPFCRILAILLFDHKKIEFKQIFKNKYYLKIKPLFKVTSDNQAICLNYPEFLNQLVCTLKAKFNEVNDLYKLFQYVDRETGQNRTNNRDNSNYTYFNISEDYEEKMGRIFSQVKSKLNHLILATVFDSLKIDWQLFREHKNKDNIFNMNLKISNLIKQFSKKNQINDKYSQYIVFMKYRTYQIEMLFVLSTLLGGKRKSEIQDKLSKQDIIESASNYINNIDWGNIHDENPRSTFTNTETNLLEETSYHGQGCQCDCDTALKIQYLRFIYSFCCRDSANLNNKMLLFSDSDIENLFKKEYMAAFINFFHDKSKNLKTKSSNMNKLFNYFDNVLNLDSLKKFNFNQMINDILIKGNYLEYFKSTIIESSQSNCKLGLLQKIILKYIHECHYSSSKFWLASCIEIVLRGNNSFIQYFVARSGILPCLLFDILYSKSEKISILQMSFDLLGELIKFNKVNFFLLNYFFTDANEFGLFCDKIISNRCLIDSNVFLRAVILSIDRFEKVFEKSDFESMMLNCKICHFVRKNMNTIFFSLIQIVKPGEINQTNISCINTSLIILIIENEKNNLGKFLMNIRMSFPNSKEVLENFKELMRIWRQFYNFRPKDCSSLEHSTSIKFKIWYEVTDILVGNDNIQDERSLNFDY